MTDTKKRYILWDPKDGPPRLTEDGTEIDSDGILGRVGRDNVYITTYATNLRTREGSVTPKALDSMVPHDLYPITADFSLSGSKGTYDIYRVSDV